MGYVFDFKAAQEYDRWYESPKNRFIADLEDRLLIRLLQPVRGERLLDIGCGTGRNLQMFKEMGLDVTGLDPSPEMLSVARSRLGHGVALHHGMAEDLPFEDNSFNIATLITTLEFVDDVPKAIEEACRVAKDRVFFGVLNRYSIKGIERRLKGIFSQSIYNRAEFFSVWELKGALRAKLGKTPLRWGTVHHLPAALRRYTQYVERWPLLWKCPFGTFIGMTVLLVPRYRAEGIALEYMPTPKEAVPGITCRFSSYGKEVDRLGSPSLRPPGR